MMEIAEVIPLITQVGFPIVACLIMYVDFRKLLKQNTEAVLKLITLVESKRFK